ncbi:MAG: stalk domain-containing protein [Nitrososphaeria archaeon]
MEKVKYLSKLGLIFIILFALVFSSFALFPKSISADDSIIGNIIEFTQPTSADWKKNSFSGFYLSPSVRYFHVEGRLLQPEMVKRFYYSLGFLGGLSLTYLGNVQPDVNIPFESDGSFAVNVFIPKQMFSLDSMTHCMITFNIEYKNGNKFSVSTKFHRPFNVIREVRLMTEGGKVEIRSYNPATKKYDVVEKTLTQPGDSFKVEIESYYNSASTLFSTYYGYPPYKIILYPTKEYYMSLLKIFMLRDFNYYAVGNASSPLDYMHSVWGYAYMVQPTSSNCIDNSEDYASANFDKLWSLSIKESGKIPLSYYLDSDPTDKVILAYFVPKSDPAVNLAQIKLKVGDPYMYVKTVKDKDFRKVEIDPGRGTAPIIKESRMFIPVRAFIEEIGKIQYPIPIQSSISVYSGIYTHPKVKYVEYGVSSFPIFYGGALSIDESYAISSLILSKQVFQEFISSDYSRLSSIEYVYNFIVQYRKGVVLPPLEKFLIDPNNPKVQPFILNGRTYIPFRYIAESLNCGVDWDDQTKTVTISVPVLGGTKTVAIDYGDNSIVTHATGAKFIDDFLVAEESADRSKTIYDIVQENLSKGYSDVMEYIYHLNKRS